MMHARVPVRWQNLAGCFRVTVSEIRMAAGASTVSCKSIRLTKENSRGRSSDILPERACHCVHTRLTEGHEAEIADESLTGQGHS